LLVTAVLARVDEGGALTLKRRLPKAMREDLDDSKRLVSHSDYALGEAWARALVGPDVATPDELLGRLTLDPIEELRRPCPAHVVAQCWASDGEGFVAPQQDVARLRRHLDALRARGVDVIAVRSSLVCVHRLNEARRAGRNRFVSDLHAMERLILELRRLAGAEVEAVCGKVGGMTQYGKFFGPLGGWLHVTLEERQEVSAYRFPSLGEVRFLRDADAKDPLVMLASLVGKYLRELAMQRIARHYALPDLAELPSGYHDPTTERFVRASRPLRQERAVPDDCFERAREAIAEVAEDAEERAAPRTSHGLVER
jgi:hypothetical protein